MRRSPRRRGQRIQQVSGQRLARLLLVLLLGLNLAVATAPVRVSEQVLGYFGAEDGQEAIAGDESPEDEDLEQDEVGLPSRRGGFLRAELAGEATRDLPAPRRPALGLPFSSPLPHARLTGRSLRLWIQSQTC